MLYGSYPLTQWSPQGKMARVLVVDDDELVEAFIVQVLNRSGHVALIAGKGARAVADIHALDYDVLVTDVCMPGIVIWDEIAALRRRGATQPIIAISGGMDLDLPEVVLRRCLEAGADLTLAKPFRVAQMVAALDTVLAPPLAAA